MNSQLICNPFIQFLTSKSAMSAILRDMGAIMSAILRNMSAITYIITSIIYHIVDFRSLMLLLPYLYHVWEGMILAFRLYLIKYAILTNQRYLSLSPLAP